MEADLSSSKNEILEGITKAWRRHFPHVPSLRLASKSAFIFAFASSSTTFYSRSIQYVAHFDSIRPHRRREHWDFLSHLHGHQSSHDESIARQWYGSSSKHMRRDLTPRWYFRPLRAWSSRAAIPTERRGWKRQRFSELERVVLIMERFCQAGNNLNFEIISFFYTFFLLSQIYHMLNQFARFTIFAMLMIKASATAT